MREAGLFRFSDFELRSWKRSRPKRLIRPSAVVLMLVLCRLAFASPGLLTTRDGKTYEGEIGIEPGGFKVTLPDQKTNCLIELPAVLRVEMKHEDKNDPVVKAGLDGNGLLGTYFSERNLSGKYVQRLDDRIDFNWGESWPVAGLPADRFSVRWTGQLRVPVTGNYTFIVQSDDGVRLWIKDRWLINHWKEHSGQELRGQRSLTAGQPYDFKVEYFDHEWGATIRLSWEGPGIRRDIIPKACFSTTDPVATRLRPAREPQHRWPTRHGILLCNGTFLAYTIEKVDDDKLKLAGAPKDVAVPLSQVARIHYWELTPEMDARVQDGQPGLLLGSRDFVEGEVKSVSQRQVKVSSVLFGLHNFDISGKVAAVVLREPALNRCSFEVDLRNGSHLRLDSLDCAQGHFLVGDTLLHGLKIHPWEISALRAAREWPAARR